MEGFSRIFGGVVDVKEGNFRQLLAALDEHQTLWTEPQHEIESHFAKVGSLLGSAVTRDRGLTALAHLIPQCPLEILEEKLQYYVNVCAKVCNQRGHVATVPLAYDMLKQLLLKSLESSDLTKLMISNIPKLLDNISSNADSSTHAATLDFLETAMRHYPGVTGSAKNRIEDYLYSLVDSDDATVVHRTGTCLLLLQQIRGGGQHGSLHKKTWDEYQCKLVDSIHELLGRVFEHTPETFDLDENLECLKLPALIVQDEPVDAARRIVTRLLNLICYLEKAVVGAYPVAKPFRPMKLLNVVLRGHAVSCQMMAKNSILENVALGMFLPQIQVQLLKLLDGIVLVLKSHLFPFRNLLTDLFEQCLKGTVSVDGKGRKKSYISLRTKVYESIAMWCETVKFGSGIEKISDSLLEHIVQDVAPYEPEVTLQVNASRQKLSAKAKKKLQKEQNAATALSKTHMSGSLESCKHLQSDYGNDVLCLAALRCLAKVLDAAGCFIKPVIQKLLQEKIVSLCVSVFSQLNTGAKQNLYYEPNCRQALLVALNSLIINPHHLCPPPLQYGVTMFSAAESQDPNVDVRSKAAELARGAETLLHPRKEMFYFPLEENAVKDMLAAKKKHPLNAVFFPEKETRPMPITFDRVKSQESPEVQSESDHSPKESEPIARVEEITIEEDQPSAVVYDLGDDETEANFNRGELQKSTAEKTVESNAIVLDSEDDNEVEVVEAEQASESKQEETPKKDVTPKKLAEESKSAGEEPVGEKLGTPKKLTLSPTPLSAQKRKPEADEEAQQSEEVDGKRAKIGEGGDDDILARVDDLVAEFVDELNDDNQRRRRRAKKLFFTRSHITSSSRARKTYVDIFFFPTWWSSSAPSPLVAFNSRTCRRLTRRRRAFPRAAETVNPGALRDDYLIQQKKSESSSSGRREASNQSEIMKQLAAALTLALFATVALGQRVVPGVNPGHYQQQQYQQPQQHYQQQPPVAQQQQYQQQPQYQQQQVPVQPQYQQQQQQQQVPVQHQQQVPVQQQGHPQQGQPHQQQHHGQPQQVLNTNNIQHEKQHIAEHMDVPIDTSKMSEQELQFHYFKMHDSDNNNKLDGCELIKSLIHWHDAKADDHHGGEGEHHGEQSEKTEAHPQDDDTLQSLIDPILELMDKDHDGFISYPEYRAAEAAEAAQNTDHH